jgi:hypothetical protein
MNSIYVFHNQTVMAMFRGLEQGDDLKLVHKTETTKHFDSEAHILRTLFAWFNHGSGQTISGYGARSLTTGDVITFVDGKTQSETSYAYRISGWIVLPKPVTNEGPYGYYRGAARRRQT